MLVSMQMLTNVMATAAADLTAIALSVVDDGVTIALSTKLLPLSYHPEANQVGQKRCTLTENIRLTSSPD